LGRPQMDQQGLITAVKIRFDRTFLPGLPLERG
jgi:hypothetical protein